MRMMHPQSGPQQQPAMPAGRPGPPPRPPRDNGQKKGWVLKGFGLLGVAVVSGMLWWLIQQGRNPPPSDQGANNANVPVREFNFTRHPKLPDNLSDSDCFDHAYQGVKQFLTKTPCTTMVRALFVTEAGGHQVYTSVSIIRMASAADAAELKALTDKSGTGNVNDLVKEKRVTVSGLSSLGGGGYEAELRDRDVIIIESDYAPGGKRTKDETALLKRISKDAMSLAEEIRRSS
jgi:hypothetical protein